MRIEHIAFNVKDPAAVAAWYRDHVGMSIERELGGPAKTTFLAAATGHVLLEIYNNPPDRVPNYAEMDPLLFHIAFECHDVEGESRRLLAAGATVAAGLTVTPSGDRLMMLRDPWGLAIQLVQRSSPMLK
ncbi:MAG TPA: VOC family protein [Anaerolineae bacterium]|nr:VOC family protein [Anaerolineae bacterium]